MTNPPSIRSMRQLSAGAHLAPEDGRCLMEYVSALAGAPFGDHPSCTDPTLAELARLVNDAISDAGRNSLVDLAPALAATPRTSTLGTALMVHAAVTAAHAANEAEPTLRHHLNRSGRWLERVMGAGWMAKLARGFDPLYRPGSARRRLAATVMALGDLLEPDRDAALESALRAAIRAAESGRARGGPVDQRLPAAQAVGPRRSPS